jgi:hypothetical protein
MTAAGPSNGLPQTCAIPGGTITVSPASATQASLVLPAMVAVTEPYGIWGGLSESERDLLLDRGIRRASSESVRVRWASRVPRLRRRA